MVTKQVRKTVKKTDKAIMEPPAPIPAPVTELKDSLDADKRLQLELLKLGKDAKNVYIESEDDPDAFKEHPQIIICNLDPKEYVYPIMMKLEHSNIVRLHALNNYLSTTLRIVDMFNWCMDLRLKRKRVTVHNKTGKKFIVNEYILEKIPACRR